MEEVDLTDYQLTWRDRFWNCFNLAQNFNSLSAPRAENGDKTMEIFNFMRVASIWLVIWGHSYLYFMKGPLQNIESITEMSTSFDMAPLNSAHYSVDTFFWMSGFMVCYNVLRVMSEFDGKRPSWILLIIKRYFRLAPVYIFTLFFFIYILGGVGNGPISFRLHEVQLHYCTKWWWTHALMISNLHPFDASDDCMGWSWYIPNDFQFFVISIPIITLLYKRRACGMVILSFLTCVCYAVIFIVCQRHKLHPSQLRMHARWFELYYMKPWIRFPPYALGIVSAVFWHSYKHEEGGWFHGAMNKIKRGHKLRKFLYISSIFSIIVMFEWSWLFNEYPDELNQTYLSLHLTFARTIFCFLLLMLTLPMLLGNGGILYKLFSNSMWIPLSRLGYGAYVSHATFQQFDAFNTDR